MSIDMFIKLKANGADIAGDASQKGFNNWIEVESFSWGVASAREAGSGLSTGRRIYKEFRWVNRHQRSSILLWKALTQNQVIEAELDVVRGSSDGTSEVFFKFFVKGARVSSFDMAGEDEAMEEIALVFTDVTATDPTTGTTHSDNFSS